MSSMTRNFKIGLLVIAAAVGLVVAAIVFGIHLVSPSTTSYHTYFDESVQGLDVGSPVKYRGVRIGAVDEIAVAPDRRHVDVVLGLGEKASTQLDLEHLSPKLRTQLVVTGLTGLKYVEIDFVDPARYPPPALPFPLPEHYIPSRPSLFTGLAADVDRVSHKLPEMADQVSSTMTKIDRILDDVDDERLVARVGEAIDKIGAASDGIRQVASHVDRARLPDQAARVLATADRALGQATSVLRRVDGDHGLVASAKRATDSVGDLGRSTLSATDELGRTVRELGDAARAVRDLAEDLQREPEILVKGRARSNRR
jgi:ABC-type transporter Mla subunit MlaD